MDPRYVRRELLGRAADVADSLVAEWGDRPERTREIEMVEYDYPDTPEGLFPWVSVCLPTDGDRLLYLRQDETRGWEPPGGRGEFGESPAETAVREVSEEVGLDVEVTDLLLIERLVFDYGLGVGAPVVQAVFAGRVEGSAPEPDTEPGIDEARWFDPEDLPEDVQFREYATDLV